jgi:hypothetical protein
MEDWEFLIQREGDLGWRSIKTGNLQLLEGNYRIVANSNLLNAPVQLRITHQSLGETLPQSRSLKRDRQSNARGTILVIPFTQLHSGIWQFLCSGTTTTQMIWHKVLKLRVIPRSTEPPLIGATKNNVMEAERDDRSLPSLENRTPLTAAPVAVATIAIEEIPEIPTPTEPLAAIATDEDSGESWAEGLERLLEQIERDSLKPTQPPVNEVLAVDKVIITTEIGTENGIELTEIEPALAQSMSTEIELERTVFAGTRPGNRIDINGACNLQLLSTNLIRAVKIDRLSICLRHPQTSETIIAIDRAVPALLSTFKFTGRIDLPSNLTITLLRGEVNLYDRHNIQLGSSGFTVTVDLSPIAESDASVLSSLNAAPPPSPSSGIQPEDLRARLDRELQLEKFTPQGAGATVRDRRSTASTRIPPLNPHQYPSAPLEYKRELTFKPQQPEQIASIHKENRDSASPIPTEPENIDRPIVTDITGDLEIDFGTSDIDRSTQSPDFDTWEVVIDD